MAVQILAGVATLVSLVLGVVAYIGISVESEAMAQGNSVDWLAFTLLIPDMLIQSGSDTVFTIFSGLFGAFYAAVIAGRPQLGFWVERAVSTNSEIHKKAS